VQLVTSDATGQRPDDDVRVEELGAMIRARLDHDGLKLRDAAGETGISSATLSRVLNGKLPDTKTFAALVRWLGVSADLFIPSRQAQSTPEAIEAHLRADRTLPPDVARALADLVRATYSSHMAAIGDEDREANQ
jgi:transcriptional regulator with XRE-family HTH domain